MKKALVLLSLIVAGSAAAGQRDFDKLDVDGNQKLSKDEFMIYIKPKAVERMTKVFNNRDKNKDGQLSRDEYTIKGQKKG